MDDGVAAFMRAMNDGFPAIETMSVSDARAVIAGRRLPVDNPDDVAGVDHRRVAGLGGDIPVRIYRPHGRNETRAEYPERRRRRWIGRSALWSRWAAAGSPRSSLAAMQRRPGPST